jgi:hypothetical protein
MTRELPHGPGLAVLAIPMPGSVRPPTDTAAAMIAWLVAHGAPRTADTLSRLQRDAWTIEPPSPDAATQTELARSRPLGGLARESAHVIGGPLALPDSGHELRAGADDRVSSGAA